MFDFEMFSCIENNSNLQLGFIAFENHFFFVFITAELNIIGTRSDIQMQLHKER